MSKFALAMITLATVAAMTSAHAGKPKDVTTETSTGCDKAANTKCSTPATTPAPAPQPVTTPAAGAAKSGPAAGGVTPAKGK